MTRNKTIAAIALAAFLGIGVGAVGATPETRTITETVTVQATPLPAPTPEIIIKTVEVPGPTITVTPSVCLEALDAFEEALQAENDILSTIAQDGDLAGVTDKQMQRVIDLDPEGIYAAAAACVAASNIGS